MKAHLRPCPACARHVRVSDEACPFCATALAQAFRATAPPALPTQRLGRTALVAFSLLGAPACDDDPALPIADASAQEGGAQPVYGAPAPMDATQGTPDAGAGTPDAKVSPDAAVVDASPGLPEGGAQPVYGAPAPLPDASADVGGGVAPAYGLPPPKGG